MGSHLLSARKRFILCTTALWSISHPISAYALPQGGIVNGGDAAIISSATQTTINQNSQRTVIDWNSFNVGAHEAVQFNQPSAASVALNRIHDANPSHIDGALRANGNVWLVNSNGVMFGQQAQVNVGGLLATSSDIDNDKFMSGDDRFTHPGNPNAAIENAGHITVADAGLVAFVAPNVSNSGVIEATLGKVQLANGDTFAVDLYGDGLLNLEVSDAVVSQLVGNSGLISAESGSVLLTAAAGEHIVDSLINMDGIIDVSAKTQGNGGTVKILAQKGTTNFSGTIEAKGGIESGNGGFIETSGDRVAITGRVNTSALRGEMGMWLIDPATIDIISSGGTNINGSTITPATVVTALNGSNVTLTGTTSITVTDAVNASGNGSGGNLILDTPTANLNALITLRSGSTLSGTATTVNVGSSGSVQNGIDAVASGGTITLANATYTPSAMLTIGKSLTLNGNSTSGSILDGQNGRRVMEIDGTGGGITVNLNKLTLTRGNSNGASESGSGGGLLVTSGSGQTATVNLTDSTVSASTTNNSGYGGGIMVKGNNGGTATLNILRSTISGNGGSTDSGGGIMNWGDNNGFATTTITNSTISGNSTDVNGGGLYNIGIRGGTGIMTIVSSTVSGNNTQYYGGGLYNNSGNTTFRNSIIAGNGSNNDAEVAGGSTSLGYNLYGASGNAGGFGSIGSDILLTGAIGTAIGSLASNGGFTQTMALVSGSAALNAGDPNYINATDQRGTTRGSSGSYTGSAADIGAYEALVLQVHADAKSITYGGSTPTFTYTLDSGPGGKLTGNVALSSSPTNAGTYTIGVGTLASSDANYLLAFTSGNYLIDTRDVTVSATSGLSKKAGETDPSLTYSLTSGSLVSGDAFSGALSRAAGESVGTYAITIGSLSLGSNYDLTFNSSLFTISLGLPSSEQVTPFQQQVIAFTKSDEPGDTNTSSNTFHAPPPDGNEGGTKNAMVELCNSPQDCAKLF